MLKIRIELVPGGDEACKCELGCAILGNVTDLDPVSDYQIRVREGYNPIAGTKAWDVCGMIVGHDRRQSAWSLVAKAAAWVLPFVGPKVTQMQLWKVGLLRLLHSELGFCPKYVYKYRTRGSHEKTIFIREVKGLFENLCWPPGGVWTASDFTDFGPRDAVDKTLQRLVTTGNLRRIDRRLYDRPRTNKLTGKPTVAEYRAVIDAIAHRDQTRMLVDGMTAANDLGLSDAVPALRGNGRMSRHYYDVHRLIAVPVGEKACTDNSLIENCIRHAKMFFYRGNTGLDTARRGSFRLRPLAAMLEPLQKDYRAMATMVFGDVPNFEEVLASVGRAEKRLNAV
jgi:hypothetical protein